MKKRFELLNEHSEYIKFTWEEPGDDWLPFLSIQINLSSNGYMAKWYRKPSNKNVLVHFLSSHHSHTKRALVGNMFQRATSMCTSREENEELHDLARQIAIPSGNEIGTPRDKLQRTATL